MQLQKIKQNHGFTLVELIVVITILAILGTIAFISLQGYSTNARDSTRISDISSMKTSLELFQMDAGKYPIPTSGVDITYSGAVVWNQGSFGESVFSNVDKLDKIPTDPLTDKEYTYSVISTRNEYELSGLIEGDTIGYKPHLTIPYQAGGLAQQVNAGTVEATAYVSGNYNGLMTKTLSGNTCKVLSLPTIITNDTSVTDLQDIITQKRFVYNGFKNLASSFKGSKFKEDGGFDFQPAQLIAYSDTGSCSDLVANTSSGTTARVTLLQGLQDSYSGTLVQTQGEIKNIVDLVIDTNTPSTEVINYAGNFVNNTLGGKLYTSGGISSSSSSGGGGSSSGGGSYPCGIGYGWNGTSCIAATSCSLGLLEIVLSNGQTWSCMNLGATTVWDGTSHITDCSSLNSPINCNSGVTWIGNYYQWGKDDNSWTNGIAGSPYNLGWEAQNDASWGGSTSDTVSLDGVGTTSEGRQGPCPSGWHVPSANDWQLACNNIIGGTCTNGMSFNPLIYSVLKLPPAGIRNWTNGNYYYNDYYGNYWTSSPSSNFGKMLFFSEIDDLLSPSDVDVRAHGFSIRCIKN